MEIHKPKPFHNWREFLKEYGIIVLGVLTALGLEQALESWHAHEKLKEVTSAIDAEVREGLTSAQVMANMQRCQQQQLAVLSDAVGRGDQARVRSLLAQGDIFNVVPFNNTAWTAALASDISSRFDQRQRTAYSGVYYVTDEEKRWTSDLGHSVARLAAFAQSGLSQSPAASADAVSEVAEMTATLSNMQRAAQVYQRFAEQGLGMKASQADVDAFLRKRNMVAECNAAAAAALGPGPKI
jgi:hypothetical protein